MKKIKYLIVVLFISPLIGFSQNTDSTEIEEVIEDSAYTAVESPEFPGGIFKMYQYLHRNLKYPREVKVEGKVMVRFRVTKEGLITDAEVIKKVHILLDAEAIRVVESMPKWKPAVQKGEKISVSYMLPISFKLR